MLTEQFINLCCAVLVDSNIKFTDSIIADVGSILQSYDEEDVALGFRLKFKLVNVMLKLRFEENTKEVILDKLISSKHFSELQSFLEHLDIHPSLCSQ